MMLKADYLVIGAGAMGMAFADSIIHNTQSSLIIVDKNNGPGGHWNVAYPYVRLHQPSAFYGVNSKELGSNRIDSKGYNKGLFELASKHQIVSYYEQVMTEFLDSNRVQFLPMTEFCEDGTLRSRNGSLINYEATKLVDATYMNVSVPSMGPPPFQVDRKSRVIAPNDLPNELGSAQTYTIIGGGKTAFDAILFLLQFGISPSAIQWVMPRDSWLLDRANIQPIMESLGMSMFHQNASIAEAKDLEDLFLRLEESGSLMRLDKTITPTMYRCATVTKTELEELRKVQKITRGSRVTSITENEIKLTQGSLPNSDQNLNIYCTSDGLAKRPTKAIFDSKRITLQSVRTCQQVFSAALIGYVETLYEDDGEKNRLLKPVPHPDETNDWLVSNQQSGENAINWTQNEAITKWLASNRLDPTSSMTTSRETFSEEQAIRMAEVFKKVADNGPRLRALIENS